MEFIFLGSASAFSTDFNNYQSNMLLKSNQGSLLLIDCGTDARRSLHALGYCHRNINHVYLSHLHADHAGGLEWLAFSRKFADNDLSKPNLYLSQQFVKPLWEHTLSGGLNSLSEESASLSSYFVVNAIEDEGQFVWENVRFQIIENRHIDSEFAHMPSFGLFFRADKLQILLTTDSQFQPEKLMPYYLKADLIFQDCETADKPSKVHAHFDQLKNLDSAIKNKMWLYHFNNSELPDAQAHGFAGFVRPGQTFQI